MWQALNIFAGEDVHEQLRGTNIDSLENILILEHNVHVAFGQMNVWFTPDEVYPLPSSLTDVASSKSLSSELCH